MKHNHNNDGRWCMVRDTKTGHNNLVEAIVVDTSARRVRLQTGEHFGEARTPGEYELLEFLTPGEAAPALAQEVATTNEA